jgi:hypothetical protein
MTKLYVVITRFGSFQLGVMKGEFRNQGHEGYVLRQNILAKAENKKNKN